MRTCDALVVGGGPAGSTCALRLREAGLDVLVVDRATFPRDKPCAGWITPDVVRLLRLDVEEYRQGRTFQVLTAFRTGRIGGPSVVTRYGRPVSFAVRRCEFDEYLLRRSGAALRLGAPVRSVRRTGDLWILDEEVRAPVLVGAGGHFCPVARFLNGPPAVREVVLAEEAEFRVSGRDASIFAAEVPEFYFSPDLQGYGWCGRKGDHLNVGLGRRDPRHLPAHIRGFLASLRRQGRLPAALPSRWKGHAYALYERTSRRVLDDGVLLVGDAAGLAYPSSGEGILPAVESGLVAADAIVAARGRYGRDRLEAYRLGLAARRGPRRRRLTLPSALASGLSAPLLTSRWFARHVLLDRYFLHLHEPALVVTPSSDTMISRCPVA